MRSNEREQRMKILINLAIMVFISTISTVKAEDFKPNLKDLAYYMEQSAFVWDDNKHILRKFPNAYIDETPKHLVKYFFINRRDRDEQVLAIRGTQNHQNYFSDLNFLLKSSKELGIKVHRGFDQATLEVMNRVLPKIDKNRPLVITGHSLGGATSLLMGMYLSKRGYNLKHIVTYGQPRITNRKGLRKFRHLPFTRVVNKGDRVTMIPPKYITTFKHFGNRVLLTSRNDYEFTKDTKFAPADTQTPLANNEIKMWKAKQKRSYQLSQMSTAILEANPKAKFEDTKEYIDFLNVIFWGKNHMLEYYVDRLNHIVENSNDLEVK